MHVLIVEDEPEFAELLQTALKQARHTFTLAQSAARAADQLVETRFDLVLLDLELPDGDGLDVLQALRERKDPTPVLIMTGGRTELAHRIDGLESGADDYLIKPFDLSELLARMHAVVRRARPGNEALVLRAGALRVDVAARQITLAGHAVDLTDREFEVLAYLARRAGRIVSRDELAREVWSLPSQTSSLDNVIDVHISRLRSKIGAEQIRTFRGRGFMLEASGAGTSTDS